MCPNFEAKAVAVVNDAVIEVDESLCEVLDASLVDMSTSEGRVGVVGREHFLEAVVELDDFAADFGIVTQKFLVSVS